MTDKCFEPVYVFEFRGYFDNHILESDFQLDLSKNVRSYTFLGLICYRSRCYSMPMLARVCQVLVLLFYFIFEIIKKKLLFVTVQSQHFFKIIVPISLWLILNLGCFSTRIMVLLLFRLV